VDPSDNVSSATGDLTESYTPISVPAPGGALALTLTYDSEASQSGSFNDPHFYGEFGFGWQTNLQSNVVVANGEAIVTEENGSQVSFFIDNGSCPSGMQNDTVLDSVDQWCGVDRIDAQFGDFGEGGYVFSEQDGRKVYTYGANGVVEESGNSFSPARNERRTRHPAGLLRMPADGLPHNSGCRPNGQ
jgi:hypothetical protein